jgi:hypothetical protein
VDFRKRRKVCFYIFLLAGAFALAGNQLRGNVQWFGWMVFFFLMGGTLVTTAVSLLLFGKIWIGPFFIVDVKSEFLRVSIGFPGFRIWMAREPMDNSLKFPGIPLYFFLSFFVRLLARFSLATIPAKALWHRIGPLSVIVGGGCFVALWILEWLFYRKFRYVAPKEDADAGEPAVEEGIDGETASADGAITEDAS